MAWRSHNFLGELNIYESNKWSTMLLWIMMQERLKVNDYFHLRLRHNRRQ